MKKGFTLVEILITIVILAVLAAIAIPGFSRSRDKAAESQAVAYLRTIRTGEKMYYAKNAAYIACGDATAIRTNLGVEVTERYYTFDVVGVAVGPPPTFLARAIGTTHTITLDQAGIFRKDGVVYSPN